MINEQGETAIHKPSYFEPIQLNGHRKIINPGSIGQPRDADPRASYAVLNFEDHIWEYRRIEYNISETQNRMHDNDLPERLIARLEHGW